MTAKPLTVAFYLPQYHPIPENDSWWGRGFTEWTNVAKATPLFRGHYQPHLPTELGYYDLRVPETRAAQAELARSHGVDAFCYYHYWFAGRRLLERPFNEVLESGEPDFPFCLCWANQTWSGVWHGDPSRILIEQTYPGADDEVAHGRHLMRAFADPRYLRVGGKPIFLIYEPSQLPEPKRLTDCWREMAHAAGFEGLYLVAWQHLHKRPWPAEQHGFDATTASALPRTWFTWKQPVARVSRYVGRRLGRPVVYEYGRVLFDVLGTEFTTAASTRHPCLLPNWDNTPRSGRHGLVLHQSTPELFRAQVKRALAAAPTMLFIKSWNEWAEGNYLEPERRFGRGYLEVLRDELKTL
jgi:hypothetical protein